MSNAKSRAFLITFLPFSARRPVMLRAGLKLHLRKFSYSCTRFFSGTVPCQTESSQPPRPLKGFRDRYGSDLLTYTSLLSAAISTATLYNYHPIQTPQLEPLSTFLRADEKIDDISKEIYSFTDRDGTQVALRPEGTASVARALISNNLLTTLPSGLTPRFYYYGPMFRHENPQRGRWRQFEQFGIELFGEDSTSSEVEVIEMAWQFLWRALGENGAKKIRLEINSLGDTESRAHYRKALTDFLAIHKESLSSDSQRRFTTNPLRILDSKHPDDAPILSQIPLLTSHLSSTSLLRLERLQSYLADLKIPFTLNPLLVRGLDYYDGTVFEFLLPNDSILGKSQSTVVAGGRYSSLVRDLSRGKYDTTGIGWAAGLDRLALLIEEKVSDSKVPRLAVIILPSTNDREKLTLFALRIASHWRHQDGLCTVIEHQHPVGSSQNLSRILRKVTQRHNPTHLIFVDDEAINTKFVIVKELNSGVQVKADIGNVAGLVRGKHFSGNENVSKIMT